MPLPPARPSAKIAKLFPQTDPLKTQPKGQTTAAPAAVTAVAQAVPLPEARPAIRPSRHAWRHRTYRHRRNTR
jgi:membrane-bound lytic murein transglycosylase A